MSSVAGRTRTLGAFPGPNQLDPITQSVLEMLSELGLIYPVKIEDTEILQWPLDITQVDLEELGQLLSYFAAQQARHTAVAGTVTAQKRSLRFLTNKAKAKFVASGDPADKQKWEKLEFQFARVDAAESICNADADAMKRYAEAASRELTRRQVEAQLAR